MCAREVGVGTLEQKCLRAELLNDLHGLLDEPRQRCAKLKEVPMEDGGKQLSAWICVAACC